jgi:hypothetical protein
MNKKSKEGERRLWIAQLLPSGGNLDYSRLDNPKIFRAETVKQGCDI